MLKALFFDHPQSVGETYRAHQKMAFGFALRLIGAGLACAIHGLVPRLFTRTGSRMVAALHKDMVENRARRMPEHPASRALRAR